MINKIIETINENNLIQDNDKIILGVSGGVDSMTLLNVMNYLKVNNKYNFDFVVVTIDHGTRNGESTKDANFVKEECDRLGIKSYIYTYDLEEEKLKTKLSLEEAGRQLRYKAFNEVLEKENANKIATAHTKDDNVETIILNTIRGTGLNGLCGIPVKQGRLIRPLINVKKEEIIKYANENNIAYKEDYTNKEDIYTRNKIRNKLIPYIKDNINENLVDTISQMQEILKVEKDFIEEESIKAFNEVSSKYLETDNNESKEIIKIDIDKLNNYHLAIKKRVFKKAVTLINDGSFKDLTNKHIDSVIDILKKGTGKQVSILNSIIARVNYDFLLIYKGVEEKNELQEVNNTYDIIVKNNDENQLVLYNNNNKLVANSIISDSNECFKTQFDNKEISIKVLSQDEYNTFMNKFNNDKENFIKELNEIKNKKIYLDFNLLVKKTDIIEDEESNAQKINTSINLRFRKREDGDKILIDDENHYKKINDIFIDEKIDREERNKFIIFEKINKDLDNDTILNNEIISVLGLRNNNKYNINESTKLILEISFDM